ncbi:unnamed protein product [Adineta ricciae]|uniref:Uncharacterized protein n=1 Tax=Adineta ricciae TaxID=249248 RepID=A0A815JMS9_ADIRI|nr:unnamed protein product [Adineta ricciae]
MFLIVLPYVELKIYLYSAQDGQAIEYYDCVMIESLFYCRRPEEPIDLHRDNVTESCEKNGGKTHLFSELRAARVNVSTVLHEWKSTLEHVERYSRYLRGSSQLDGHNCEYHLPVGTTLQDALEWQLKISGRVATGNAFGTDVGLRKGPEYGECRSQRDQRFIYWIFINGTVRCGDALVSTTQRIEFSTYWNERRIIDEIFCNLNSSTVLGNGTSVRAERFCFRSSNDQLTCLSVTVLGDNRHDCPNQFDELWLGTNRNSHSFSFLLRHFLEHRLAGSLRQS